MSNLTPKQQRFVEEYLVDLNATQAATRAGYSAKTANEQGARLLANVSVQEAVQKAIAERSARTEITQDRVLQEYAKIGFSDIRGFFDESGALRSVTALSDDLARAVSSIEVVTKTIPAGDGEVDVEYTHKLKLWDKKGALDSIARHLGMFNDKLALGADESLAALMKVIDGRNRGLPN